MIAKDRSILKAANGDSDQSSWALTYECILSQIEFGLKKKKQKKTRK